MLSALPNLFLMRCANSLGFDITVLKKKKTQMLQAIHQQEDKQTTNNVQHTTHTLKSL
jgi:uncharacterized protein YmfQ (DUF2313 family)